MRSLGFVVLRSPNNPNPNDPVSPGDSGAPEGVDDEE
jgi:hypothetical protein